MNGVEVEEAPLERRRERELVADPDLGHLVEIRGNGDVGLPAWVERAKKDPTFKADFSASLAENLMKIAHRHMPALVGKTPKMIRSGIPMGCNPRAWHGCSLGLEPSGERFVKHTHWLRPKTSIEGLWMTGQDAFSAGFAGSMIASRLTYSAMTGDWLFMLNP